MYFFGIGVVATATLYGAHTGPFQVGIIWGIAIAIAIYATRNLFCAPFIGGALAALIFTKIIEPIQSSTSNTNCC